MVLKKALYHIINYELLEERDKIRNEIIKLEQSILDAEVKKAQLEAEAKSKAAQIEAENKRDKIRNRITVGTFVVSTMFSAYAVFKTFKFDKEATITSTLGRNILNSAIPKMFRR